MASNEAGEEISGSNNLNHSNGDSLINNHYQSNGLKTILNAASNATHRNDQSNGSSNATGSGETNMSNGGAVINGNSSNGESTNGNGGGQSSQSSSSNGANKDKHDAALPRRLFSNGQKDILRLIGQHLRYLGLSKTTETLVSESGCMLEHPIAANFCSLIMNGSWEEAERALNNLRPIMENSSTDITNMKFLILEQKYLECLEDGKIMEALKCLRDELAPLKFNIDRLHELSSFLMCSDHLNLKAISKWGGKNAISRQTLMDKLQTFLPPNIMLPPHRLETLLNQSIDYQCEQCPYHNVKDKGSIDTWSFLRDHTCSKDLFPSVTLQVLNDHCDEVWYCKFSNNGKRLATGSKDGCLIIWDIDPISYKLTMNKSYEDHTCGVAFVTWSPDDRYLIACGSEESTELWVWDIENKTLKKRINHNHDDSLTSAAWLPDGQTFVTGGAKGQFYFCDLDGNIRDTWEGIRVKSLQTLPDGLVLAADSLKRIRSYNFKEISDSNLIQEDHQIMSFTLNKTSNLVLITLANQGLHLWDVKDKVLVRRYQGALQNIFIGYATFGGVDENFIASGSEDSRVYIWNKRNEQPICILEGHTRNVSCVAWNPLYLGMVASASDDGTVRIWGPTCKQVSNENSQTSRNIGNSIESSDLNTQNFNLNNISDESSTPTGSNSNFTGNLENLSNNPSMYTFVSASSSSSSSSSFTNTLLPPPFYSNVSLQQQQQQPQLPPPPPPPPSSSNASSSSNSRSDRSTPV